MWNCFLGGSAVARAGSRSRTAGTRDRSVCSSAGGLSQGLAGSASPRFDCSPCTSLGRASRLRFGLRGGGQDWDASHVGACSVLVLALGLVLNSQQQAWGWFSVAGRPLNGMRWISGFPHPAAINFLVISIT